VTGLAFHPSADQAVTTGEEGAFRVWGRAAAPARGRGVAAAAAGAAGAQAPKGHWLCRSVGSYRDAPMTAAAFSADGSLVAVAAADTVRCGRGLSRGCCWQCTGLTQHFRIFAMLWSACMH
jgi:NET1-associated nuclear protein 1 (U3 small nucleolar RNA-associated protein 17)